MDHHGNPLICESWADGPPAATPPLPWDVYWEYAWFRSWQAETQGRPTVFVYRSSDKVFLHSFLVHAIDGSDGVDLETPYGYGGPLANTEDREFLDAAWRAFAAWAEKSGVVSEFIRFHPLLDNARFVTDAQYRINVDRQTVWVSCVTNSDESGPSADEPMSSAFRRGIRVARQAGLTFSERSYADYRQEFRQLYLTTMDRLHADPIYYFKEAYWDALTSPSLKPRLFVVRSGDRIAAAALCFESPPFLHYHLGASDADLLNLRPNNLLFSELIQTACRTPGIRYLHLGGGSDSSADNSLLRFKSGVGGRRSLFRTGRRIWNPAVYERLKAETLRRYPELRQYDGVYLQIHRLPALRKREERS